MASLVEEALPRETRQLLSDIPEGLSCSDRLAEVAVRLVEFVATHPTLGLLLHRAVPKLSSEAQERVAAAHGDLVTEFAQIYQRGVQSGEFRPLPPDIAAGFIQDLIMSAARTLNQEPEPKQRLPEVAESLVDFLRHGLLH